MKTSVAVLLLGLALAQALPAEKKTEKPLKKDDLKIEETGEDTDRSKKSIICLDQPNVVPQMQSYSIQAAPQPVQTLSIQPAQQLQTLNIQPAVQPVQTLSIQQSPQPVQTLNIQPAQPIIQSQPVISQPMHMVQQQVQPQPIMTQPMQSYNVEVMAVPQPVPCQTNVNIVQPVKQDKSEVESVPKKIVKPEPRPEKVVIQKVEKEKPVMPVYREEMMVVPRPMPQPRPLMVVEPQPMTYVPAAPVCNQCQQSLMQCTCRPQSLNSMMVEPQMQMMTVKRPVGALVDHHVHPIVESF